MYYKCAVSSAHKGFQQRQRCRTSKKKPRKLRPPPPQMQKNGPQSGVVFRWRHWRPQQTSCLLLLLPDVLSCFSSLVLLSETCHFREPVAGKRRNWILSRSLSSKSVQLRLHLCWKHPPGLASAVASAFLSPRVWGKKGRSDRCGPNWQRVAAFLQHFPHSPVYIHIFVILHEYV